MFADLMAEMPAGERYGEAARAWLAGVLGELFPDLREGLRTRPSTRVISKHWDEGLEGEPGQVRGELEIGLTAERSWTVVFTEAAWERFLGSLSESPVTASLSIRVIGEDGYLGDGEAEIRVVRPEEEPGWVRFTIQAPARFTRPDRWAVAVKRQAARVGACAGMITSRGGGPGMFETVTYPDWPPEMVVQLPEYVQEIAMLGADREVLYRYSWVTIIPPELAARVGGTAGLAASAALAPVLVVATNL